MSRIKSFLRENWMRVILVVVALVGLVVAVTSAFGPRLATEEGEVTFAIAKKAEFEKGDNAFELFKDLEGFEFEYSESEFGIFIEGINGVFGEDTGKVDENGAPIWRFWKLYVNGEVSTVGIDQVELTDGAVIEFRFEE